MPSFAVITVVMTAGNVPTPPQSWAGAANTLNKSSPSTGTSKRPGEGVWVLELPIDTGLLATIVQTCESFQVPVRVLYFDQPPSIYESPKL